MRPRTLALALVSCAIVTCGVLATAVGAQPPVGTSGTDSSNEPVLDCGTFTVWDQFEFSWNGREIFDKEGNLIRVVERVWGTDHLYNPTNGKSVEGTVTANEVVDLVDGQITENGSVFRIIVPGMGAVFVDIGKFVIDFDDGLIFLAGRHDFFDGDSAALCALLA